MPSLADVVRTAGLDNAAYQNLRRSGHIDHWGELSPGFAIRLGIYAILRASGFSFARSISLADEWASLNKLPRLVAINPLTGMMRVISSDKSNAVDVTHLRSTVADVRGELLSEEGDVFDMAQVPMANGVVIIAVADIVRDMRNLFN